ncbi:PTS system maltose-specific EIICB component [Brachyspira suanatina]|uniref:PTS system maltose-specific EIICB component n=1 Tax=Brachyspira suanatina TaxID=381802 RepID=A0A0G4K885_9SPIR|nr:alpha-glucoside-specific PTS transporter subunit IIBC [Brachyspira suanatina]CRF34109.1 PTS system maltose-specific EIICB component [Brachyspira suanatina]
MFANIDLRASFQKFGAAMFVPVLLFSFSGLIAGLTIIFKDQYIVGNLADPEGIFYKFVFIIEEGAWTIFRNMPLFFCLGIPIGLSKMAPERAILATLICYLSYNYFISAILNFFGPYFGVDFTQEVGGVSGLTLIAGIKTLDTNIIGAIFIGFVITIIHNRFYETKLPDYLGVFQGTSFVHIIGFFVVLVLAFLTCLIWPKIQNLIYSMQTFLIKAGGVGVFIYTFLERILIPTGLHHFIYGPFIYGPAVVPEGIEAYWINHVAEFSNMLEPFKDLFPEGGFALHGNSKVFGAPGLALAIYFCANNENRKKIAALLIPVTLTSVLVGITEPLEFTFLFISPFLFLVHSILAATLSTVLYVVGGVVGNYGSGLIAFITQNWIFAIKNHSAMVIANIVIGLIFTAIWFFLFRFLILKFNIKTPGRGDSDIKLYTKKDYKEEREVKKSNFEDQAAIYLEALGGRNNIEHFTNCATRLRVTVKDINLVKDAAYFQKAGSYGVVKKGNAIQIIIGLSVSQVKAKFEELLKNDE